MKKSIFIIASFAAVVLLSSFMIAHNVTSDKADTPVTVSSNDQWEYYKPVNVYYKDRSGKICSCERYVFKKTVCGDPDYLLSEYKSKLGFEQAISKNYYYGKDQDWTSEYKYTARVPGQGWQGYFSTYLQGWD